MGDIIFVGLYAALAKNESGILSGIINML